MNINLVLILKMIVLFIVLAYSTKILTGVLVNLSKYFKVSSFAIGIVFMAVATSIPELFIGIQSALQNVPDLSLGTVLGSNISDLAFVLGIIIIFSKTAIKTKESIKISDAWWMFVYALIPVLLSIDGVISKIDGIILMIMFIIYIYYIFLSKQKVAKNIKHPSHRHFLIDIGKFILGVGLLLFSSHYLVQYGLEIANDFAIPTIVIGVTIYALSTSLPELSFELRAIHEKKESMAMGDLIGSIIVNSSLVLGVTAIITPITISNIAEYVPTILVLFITAGFFFYKVLNGKKLRLIDGFLLITIYVIFIISEFGILELNF